MAVHTLPFQVAAVGRFPLGPVGFDLGGGNVHPVARQKSLVGQDTAANPPDPGMVALVQLAPFHVASHGLATAETTMFPAMAHVAAAASHETEFAVAVAGGSSGVCAHAEPSQN